MQRTRSNFEMKQTILVVEMFTETYGSEEFQQSQTVLNYQIKSYENICST